MHWDRYAVVDVETTGFSPAADRIVEIACVLVDEEHVVGRWSTLVNPGIPIPSRASEIHGITGKLVAGAPNIDWAMAGVRRRCAGRLMVAHNARFDLAFLGWSSGATICTVRLARELVPEAPNHKNQTLRRFLDLDHILGELGAHRALDDALVTAHVLIACRQRFRARFPGRSWQAFLRETALVRMASSQRRAS